MKHMGREDAADSRRTFGRYRLLEQLGRGGMADVYKAKSFGVEGFEKVLVVKCIVPELAAHEEFVDMFVQEAKLAVRLSHANIVQVFDLGRIEAPEGSVPSYYIAMEYVDGVDLATVLRRFRKQRQPLPLGMAVFVATEVAKALDHAHRRRDEKGRALGIIHRDISPHNVLLSWDGDVKVTDFGIAKAADAITRDEDQNELEVGRVAGKLTYMSPEQARNEPTDARGDLFSLGVVLYELIAGDNPFVELTASETVRRICAGEYTPLGLARSGAPEALCAIVDQLLAPLPKERIGSAAELCELLLTYSYESGERFGHAELGALLAPLRGRPRAPEVEAAAVLAEPTTAADKTPVEIPLVQPAGEADVAYPGGERRDVSALVVGLGGSEAPSPEARARVREVLERHGAWIQDEEETQVTAIFGLGEADGRDTEAAVRAALVLVRERFGELVPSAGVHSGPILIDAEGLPVPDERLSALFATAQALARGSDGQVALSHRAGRLVRRSFVLEPLPETGHAIQDGGYVARAGHASDAQLGRFVGRHAELKTLGGILASATRRAPQLVVLSGEPGIGKTRLLSEAKRRLERGNFNVAFYVASCPLHGADIPWSGLRAMLHVLCGTQEDDPPRRILEVRPRLRALALGDEQSAAVLSLLGAPAKAGEPDGGPLLRAAFEQMVSSLCQDRVHCLAWDDAQAIDRESLDAILKVMRHPGGLSVTVMLALRGSAPELVQSWRTLHPIALGQLSEAETARFVEAQLGARAVPSELLRHVRAVAGGHPLFLDELLHELTDSGSVRVLSGKVVALPEEQSTASRQLPELIAARVSRLPADERRVLQAVAILGVPAFTHVLASVLDETLPSLDRHLASLGAKGMLRRTGPTKVHFASPLYGEIVLAGMPAAERQQLHARAAETYRHSAVSPAGGDAPERVAQHLLEAGQRGAAVDYYWQSAEQKLARGQLELAVRNMVRALEVADLAARSVDQLAAWIAKLASTVSQVRSAPGLRNAAWAAVRQIEARGTPRQRGKAYIDLALGLGSVNLFEEAYQALEQADLDASNDVELKRAGLGADISIAARQGLFLRAVAAADRLEQLGEIEDVPTLLAVAHARGAIGQSEVAHKLLDRVDAISEPADAAEAVMRQKTRCLIYFDSRDFEAAAREARQLARLARSAGLRYDAAAALHNLGDALDRMGDHARSYAAFLESIDITRLIDHERLTALNSMHLSLLDGLRNVPGAEDRLKGLIRFAEARGYLWDVLEGRFLVARLALHRGALDEARRCLEEVVALAEQQGHELIAVDGRALLASL